MSIKVEVCINSDGKQGVYESVEFANRGGASTIELCGSMNLDGMTPKDSQIIEARRALKEAEGLMVMIRPRSGDFYFSVREIDIMVQQIKNAAKFGANGVVLGVLNQSDNTINSMGLNCLIEECKHRNLKVTFHRAFDAVADHVKALETLVDLKINRILTSGTRWGSNKTAVEGIKRLSEIINASRQRIEIVVGGGINYKNITQILSAIPIIGNNISVHTYSGVLINGMVDLQEVKKLVGIVEKF